MINQLIKHLPTIDPEDIKEFYEERAGIREFDGGMSKEDAEREAFYDTLSFFGYEHNINQATNI